MNIEIWKDIDGYSNYQVSTLGRVKSLDYHLTNKEQILKPGTKKGGYLFVNLYENRKRKGYLVHRLVAEAFIDNPDNLPCIDHINTIRTDNRVDNLKWCTHKENNNNPLTKEKMRGKLAPMYGRKGELAPMYGRKGELHPMYGRRGELHPMYGRRGELHPNSKPILQLSLNGELIKMWDCARNIERELGFNHSSISKCCNGKLNSAYNFKWCFAS